MRYFKSVVALGTVFGAFISAPAVQAQTFAKFVTSSAARILYTDGGSGAGVDTISLVNFSGTSASPVYTPTSSVASTFFYQTANGAELAGDGSVGISSLMSFTAKSSANVVVGTPNTQAFDSVIIKFTNRFNYTSNNGTFFAAGTANLLTLQVLTGSGATGILTASDNSQNPTFTGSQSNGAIIGYTSDFLDFSGSVTDKNYGISQSSAVDRTTNSTGIERTGTGSNGNFDSFTASFEGSFGATPLPTSMNPTPAPPGVVSGLIGIAMGGAQFGMMKFRGRRRAKKTEVAA